MSQNRKRTLSPASREDESSYKRSRIDDYYPLILPTSGTQSHYPQPSPWPYTAGWSYPVAYAGWSPHYPPDLSRTDRDERPYPSSSPQSPDRDRRSYSPPHSPRPGRTGRDERPYPSSYPQSPDRDRRSYSPPHSPRPGRTGRDERPYPPSYPQSSDRNKRPQSIRSDSDRLPNRFSGSDSREQLRHSDDRRLYSSPPSSSQNFSVHANQMSKPSQQKRCQSEKTLTANYQNYLNVAQGTRVSSSDFNRRVEKNVLHRYGVIPQEIYSDVYKAAYAYATLLFDFEGFPIDKNPTAPKKLLNIGCAVLWDQSTNTRKLMLIPSGLRSFQRFKNTELPLNEKIHNALKNGTHNALKVIQELTHKGNFSEILHFTDHSSAKFTEQQIRIQDAHFDHRMRYGCSEPAIFDECEKFCAENPQDHKIDGTVEFNIGIRKNKHDTYTIVSFEPAESCVSVCEQYDDVHYYDHARNRNDPALSPLRARPIGESFSDRVNYYSECITAYETESKTIENKLTDMQTEMKNIDRNLFDLHETHKKNMTKLQQNKRKIDRTAMEINEANLALTNLQLTNTNLEPDIKFLEEKIESITSNIGEIEIQMRKLEIAKQATEDMELIKDAHNINIEKLISEERDRRQSTNKDEMEHFTLKRKAIEEEYNIKGIYAQIKSAQDEITRWKSVNTEEGKTFIADLNNLIASDQTKVRQLEEEHKEVERRISALKSAITNKRKSCAEATEKYKEDKKKLQQIYEENCIHLQDKIKYYEENQDEYHRSKGLLSKLHADKDKHLQQLEVLKADQRKIKNTLDTQKQENDDLQVKMDQLLQTSDHLQTVIKETEQTITTQEQHKAKILATTYERHLHLHKIKLFGSHLASRVSNYNRTIKEEERKDADLRFQ